MSVWVRLKVTVKVKAIACVYKEKLGIAACGITAGEQNLYFTLLKDKF